MSLLSTFGVDPAFVCNAYFFHSVNISSYASHEYICCSEVLFLLPLQETIKMCDNRVVLFDNKTKDSKKIVEQRNNLLSLVTLVLEKNDGIPYTNELFKQLKVCV